MKKAAKAVSCLISALMGCTVLASCKDGLLSGGTTLSFWVYGDNEELAMYQALTEEFNATYGKEHNITVENTPKPVSGYAQQVQLFASSNSGPDVFFTWEDVFKGWVNAGYLADMTSDIEAASEKIDITGIYDTVVERLHYNVETNTSKDSDPLYGLPLDTKPSAIYYNESFFESMGIIVISVDADQMDKWNNNEIPDNRGNYKRDFAKLANINVPKKGYYRSENPYVYDSFANWSKPASDEILVFNNRIAMNWDELEDLARLFTPAYGGNDAAKCVGSDGYGFFSEWWFNYGWSVGGDCLTDLTGDGNWNFSLLDYTENYVVQPGKTYTGEYTGKTYAAGETLELTDKLALEKGKSLVADDVGGYHAKNSSNEALSDAEKGGSGALDIRSTVKTAENEGVLAELPSTRDAFCRYLKLGATTEAKIEDEGGLDISPNPTVFSSRTRQNYFYSGKMAMLVDYASYMSAISEQMEDRGWKWDVAPLAVYKRYENPSDPDNDTVVAQGKVAGQSNSKAMVSREKSKKKAEAAEFICWCASRAGQAVLAKKGFFTNYLDMVDEIQFPGYAPKNVKAFAEAMEFEGPGDWWYMKDYEWINVWAVPLNSNVRNGRQTYSSWKETAIKDTNERLLSY